MFDAFHAGDFGGPHLEELVQQEPPYSRRKAPGALFHHLFPGFEVVWTILHVQGFHHVQETLNGGLVNLPGPFCGRSVLEGKRLIAPCVKKPVIVWGLGI